MTIEADMTSTYLEVISLIERLHRNFLDVVKLELDNAEIRDINNVQSLLLFNIGDTEMTIGELILRGCYLGSNVSYNVKKVVENGYRVAERSMHDHRSVHVRLSDKGHERSDTAVRTIRSLMCQPGRKHRAESSKIRRYTRASDVSRSSNLVAGATGRILASASGSIPTIGCN